MANSVRTWSGAIRRYIGTGVSVWVMALVGLSGLYLVLAPSTTPLTSLDLYNDKRLWQVVLLVATGGVLLAVPSARRQWLSTFRTLPLGARFGLGATLGLGGLSAVLAPSPGYAALEIGHFVLLFVLAGAVATAVRQAPRRTETLLLGAVVLSAFLYAVHFAVGYGLSVAWPALEVGRESISGFGNIRFFNQYQTWTLPLLGAAVLAIPARWRVLRGGVFFLAALWWTLVLVSNGRGTPVAVLGAGVVVAVLFRKAAWRWLGVQGTAVVAGGVLYFFAFHLVGDVAPQVADRLAEGDQRRLTRWMVTLELAGAHPWLGAGPMHFSWAPFRLASGAHPHNAWLQWLAEWGVPSTVVMTGLTAWGSGQWIHQERRDAGAATIAENAVRVGLVAAILAGAAHAMVSGLLVMPVSQVLLAVFGGWAWGRYRPQTESEDGRSSRTAQTALCILLAGAVVIVGGKSGLDLTQTKERRAAYFEAVDRSSYSPRYWQQGYIGVRDPSLQENARPDQ